MPFGVCSQCYAWALPSVMRSSHSGTASFQWGGSYPLFPSGFWVSVALQGWCTPQQVKSMPGGRGAVSG